LGKAYFAPLQSYKKFSGGGKCFSLKKQKNHLPHYRKGGSSQRQPAKQTMWKALEIVLNHQTQTVGLALGGIHIGTRTVQIL
jgi:hypothetical protein